MTKVDAEMASSYSLVETTDNDYKKLIELYENKRSHHHTLFTANLPLMWKTCNGGGVLSGGTAPWRTIDKLSKAGDFVSTRRVRIERILRENMTDELVNKVCAEIASKVGDYNDTIAFFVLTHPSDWLVSIFYFLSSMRPLRRQKFIGTKLADEFSTKALEREQ